LPNGSQIQRAQTPAAKNSDERAEEAPIGGTRRVGRAAKAMAGDFQNILGLLTIVGVIFYGILLSDTIDIMMS
jgi:hypothetical protein